MNLSRHWLSSQGVDVSELENILTLSVDMLDGDLEARAILADLLEEAGRERVATLARSDAKSRPAMRLRMTLGALPAKAVIMLGASFIEHIIIREPDEYIGRKPYLYALKKVSDWCQGRIEQFPTSPVILFETATPSDLRHGHSSNHRSRSSKWQLGKALQNFATAIRGTLAEYEVAPVGTAIWFDEIGTADLHVNQAAEEAREQEASTEGQEAHNPRTELQWQIGRTRDFLVGLRDSI